MVTSGLDSGLPPFTPFLSVAPGPLWTATEVLDDEVPAPGDVRRARTVNVESGGISIADADEARGYWCVRGPL